MTEKTQSQCVEGGGHAIQSGNDTIFNQGLGASELKQIIAAIGDQALAFTKIAQQVVRERVEELEKRIHDRFQQDEAARREAFKEPNFQFTVVEACKAFAKTGDDQSGDTLVDLIARRSQETERSRRALVLDSAVEKVSNLTKEEFDILAFILVTKHSAIGSVLDHVGFYNHARLRYIPFIHKSEPDFTAIMHLQSQGCVELQPQEMSFWEVCARTYPGVFSKGVPAQQLHSIISDPADRAIISTLLYPSPFQEGYVKIRIGTMAHVKQLAEHLRSATQDNIIEILHAEGALMGDLCKLLPPDAASELLRVQTYWDKSKMNRASLLPVGMALGHAQYSNVVSDELNLDNYLF